MFMARRPSPRTIERFIDRSQRLPLSYGPVGLLHDPPRHRRVDEAVVVIGQGRAAFERAQRAIASWQPFAIGWVELFPRHAPIAPGTVVAVLIRHLGFWSLNGCRIVYGVGDGIARFGFAYGTLTNHAEAGEEIFEVMMDPDSLQVSYRIHAISWPRATLARFGQPIVRTLQARFRRDSAMAMRRAVAEPDVGEP